MIITNALTLLQQRNSQSKLQEPAPTSVELNEIFKAALRVPDHARLQPTRFLLVSGKAREKLGSVFLQAHLLKDVGLAEEKQQKLLSNPLRAPLIITVIANVIEHAKVPAQEQLLSAACSAYAVLLAAEALGYGAIWRTGDMAYDKYVHQQLGLCNTETIIGFIYVGTAAVEPKPLPEIDINALTRYFPE